MKFNDELKDKIEDIESIIRDYLPEETGFQKTIFSAMNYSILAGGKRLRPMLMLETYRLLGGGMNEKLIKPFVAAIEMIHTYSLVHDDLPAIDNDDYRRGRLTTHKVFGEDIGVLTGDALLNYAFETALLAFEVEGCSYPLVAKALSVLVRKAGIYGMLGGQAVDVELTNKPMNKEQLQFVHELKTGALIEASMMVGAILAGASEKTVLVIEEIASNIGLAFQIKDDILDVTSTTEELGKPVHSDEKNDKVTYVTLYGIENAQKKVEEVSKKAIERFDSLECKNEFLRELILYLVTRKK